MVSSLKESTKNDKKIALIRGQGAYCREKVWRDNNNFFLDFHSFITQKYITE